MNKSLNIIAINITVILLSVAISHWYYNGKMLDKTNHLDRREKYKILELKDDLKAAEHKLNSKSAERAYQLAIQSAEHRSREESNKHKWRSRIIIECLHRHTPDDCKQFSDTIKQLQPLELQAPSTQ